MDAVEHGFYGVCVPPYFVEKAIQYLANSAVKVITVVGFPFGYQTVYAKIEECKRYIALGADEIDVVVNIAAIKSEDWEYVESEIDGLATAVSRKDRKIKVIIETSYLTDDELVRVIKICVSNKVHYIKTSTGYSDRGASVEDIIKINNIVKGKAKIKASGGIRDAETARQMIEAGADRIGTSSGVDIVKA